MPLIKRLSALDPVADLSGDAVIPVTQDGATYGATAAQMAAFAAAYSAENERLYYDLTDRFLGSETTAGLIGDMHWRTGASSGTPSTSFQTVAGRIGVVRLSTGASNGNDQRMYLRTNQDDGIIDPGKMTYMSWVVAIPTITANTRVRLGLMGPNLSGSVVDGLYFQYDTSVTSTWQAIARASSSETKVTGPNAAAGNYYLLELARDGSAWRARVNGSDIGTLATNIPAPGTTLPLGVHLQTITNAARSVDIDHFDLRMLRGQLWT